VTDAATTILYQNQCLLNELTELKIQCPSDERIKILKTVLNLKLKIFKIIILNFLYSGIWFQSWIFIKTI
jgi:hypothetical protein